MVSATPRRAVAPGAPATTGAAEACAVVEAAAGAAAAPAPVPCTGAALESRAAGEPDAAACVADESGEAAGADDGSGVAVVSAAAGSPAVAGAEARQHASNAAITRDGQRDARGDTRPFRVMPTISAIVACETIRNAAERRP